MDEYDKFLQALKLNFGVGTSDFKTILSSLHDRSALTGEKNVYPKKYLLRLTKLLWLKPGQSVKFFEDLFEETYFLDFQNILNSDDKFTNIKNGKDDVISPKKHIDEKIKEPTEIDYPSSSESDLAAPAIEKKVDLKPITVRIGLGQHDANIDISLEQSKEAELEKTKFLFTDNYYPINIRKTQQNLRAFQVFRYLSDSNEIDENATINKAIEKGFFNEIEFKKNKINITNFLILIDHEGSMVAFDKLSDDILAQMEIALVPAGNLKSEFLKTFYFYNLCKNFLFENKTHTKFKDLNKTLAYIKNKQTSIIILSDAGAARGTYNEKRINATYNLLKKLYDYTNKIAWLNPMPKNRWKNTSAEKIAERVAMYEITEKGISNVVALLKGASIKVIR